MGVDSLTRRMVGGGFRVMDKVDQAAAYAETGHHHEKHGHDLRWGLWLKEVEQADYAGGGGIQKCMFQHTMPGMRSNTVVLNGSR